VTSREERQKHVAEIITDLWPHRMSQRAAEAIENYYNNQATVVSPTPKHKAGTSVPDPGVQEAWRQMSEDLGTRLGHPGGHYG